jgi:purine nucleoside phosphorylase
VTNPAAGISETPLSHHEVMAEGKRAGVAFCSLVEQWVARLGD